MWIHAIFFIKKDNFKTSKTYRYNEVIGLDIDRR